MRRLAALMMAAAAAFAADSRWIEAAGGDVQRGSDGAVLAVSLARTWATDNDVQRLLEYRTIRRLDLSFTYVTDRGIEQLKQLPALEDLKLDTAEFITDAAMSYLRANRQTLRRLNLRGTDITDVSLPYLAELTSLESLDLSYTQLGDVGIESLPALANLQELNLGGTRISGLNLSVLKLLPKLRSLSFTGIQRRNAGACWSPLITDLDVDAIADVVRLEELDLGIGVSLGRTGVPVGAGNCRVAGGIKISDLALGKIARLKNLRRLDVSGAKITPAGLKALQQLPHLERLGLWNCAAIDDSAAPVLAAMSALRFLDLSYTPAGDGALGALASVKQLKNLYLTDTKTTSEAVEAFRKQRGDVLVSWGRRPDPIPGGPKPSKKAKKGDDQQ